MLELLGTIAGNVLSLPGILGLGVGMLTKRTPIAALLGGLVGVFEAMVFADFSFASIGALELIISVFVGVAAGSLGSAIRRKGTLA